MRRAVLLLLLSRVQRQMMEEPQHASSLIGNEGLELAPELHGALRHAAALNAAAQGRA